MDRNEKLDFIIAYMKYLAEVRNKASGIDNPFRSGGVIFDNCRLDVRQMFNSFSYCSRDAHQKMETEIEDIGDMEQYIREREDNEFFSDGKDYIKKDKELVFYMQLPSELYNVLYGLSYMDSKLQKWIDKKFDELLKQFKLRYDLLSYERNTILVYKL